MNRQELSTLAHRRHPIAAPLSDDSVDALLDEALPHEDARVLDLGCGGAPWLLRALSSRPRLRATGVDVSASALRRAREDAHRLGVQDRLDVHQCDAAGFRDPEPFDLVISVGATHAFGGLLPTLEAARTHLAPGGSILVGDGYWERTPSPEAVELLGECDDLATTVESVTAAGWTPVHAHLSTRRELDDYEWSWTGSLASWALDHPDHPDSDQALRTAHAHRTEWLRVYRDCFGFACFVLRPTGGREPREEGAGVQ
ncbi:class I SAM-dependent methyltransferase [Streptomyces sp. NA04227]|uniref:SAM-dependent methyltransferase n=1 Tax=Streptomyces sp. NA04227 TaxID=2742136 RepID=UPI0015901C89|nr:class I SAM-dependent methyltransferase [Streptomyces sp. NA04227]QKW06681.1 class I SAM-dependent methyltransferase [Streptomyces sp. NA04227]